MPRIIKMAKGTYTSSTVTVDGEGRVISASSGAGGAGAGVLKQATGAGPASGTWTANPAANLVMAYIGGAGGGGGGNNRPVRHGGVGGVGGYGYFAAAVTGGTGYDYNLGAAGTGGPPGTSQGPMVGNAGGSSTLTNIGTSNGGAGGQGGGSPNNESSGGVGATGSAPGASIDVSAAENTSLVFRPDSSNVMGGGTGKGPGGTGSGNTGKGGYITIYDNSGT